ncbi:MAG: glycosyltransferase family 4 protein [Candidatus Tectomicrobia bacterium]
MRVDARKHEFLFIMTGAHGLCGGIANANLNVLHALSELAAEKALGFTVFSYLEGNRDRPDFLPQWIGFQGFQGRKWHFVSNLLRAAARRPTLCFDHVTLALPVLPLAAAGVVKTIILAHGSEAWKRLRQTSRWSLQYASLCLTNSQFTLGKMRQHIANFNGEACPLGLSPAFALNREMPGASEAHAAFEAADGRTRTLGKRYLLLVARMDQREGKKGHRDLINVLPALLGEFPEVQVVLPGPGDDRNNLQALAQRKGVAPSVFLPGFVSTETLRSLYRDCYAFVLPSQQEGFGLAYLEAMNYAKPCVGCYDQGAEDVIVHGESGFLVHDPHNAQELLGILQALLRHPELTQQLGRNGFARLHNGFTSRHYQDRLKKNLARVL